MRRRIALAILWMVTVLLFAGCGGNGGGTGDTIAPVIGSVEVSREANTNRVIVQARVRDMESGLSGVTAEVLLPTPSSVSMSPQFEPVDGYRASLPADTARLRVKAVDREGNQTLSPEIGVPPPAPPF